MADRSAQGMSPTRNKQFLCVLNTEASLPVSESDKDNTPSLHVRDDDVEDSYVDYVPTNDDCYSSPHRNLSFGDDMDIHTHHTSSMSFDPGTQSVPSTPKAARARSNSSFNAQFDGSL